MYVYMMYLLVAVMKISVTQERRREEVKAVCKDAFKLEDGPFIKALEAVLDCASGGLLWGNIYRQSWQQVPEGIHSV